MNFQRDQSFPEFATARDRQIVRKLATRYVLCGEQLYKRSFNHVLLRCLTEEEVQQVMHEVHAGVCGGHVNSMMLAKKRMYFSTMEADCYSQVLSAVATGVKFTGT